MKRKGLGKNKGKGYYNILPIDSHIHSLSAKGVKTRINPLTKNPYVKTGKKCFRCGSPVYETDVKDYKYVCLNCDENMDEFEVRAKGKMTKKQREMFKKEYGNMVKDMNRFQLNRAMEDIKKRTISKKETVPFGSAVYQVEEEGMVFWTLDKQQGKVLQKKMLTEDLWNSNQLSDTDREFIKEEYK